MKINIGDISLDLNFDSANFRNSELKKKKRISISASLIVRDIQRPTNQSIQMEKLDRLRQMDSIPCTIWAQKANYYFWVFGGCKLASKAIRLDTCYYSFNFETWKIDLEIEYEEVFGTNSEAAARREIAMRKLFERD